MLTAEVSDRDVVEAMQRISGYLDITPADFRELLVVAREQVVQRLFARLRAGDLMHKIIDPLRRGHRLDEAARIMADQGLKSIPVVDELDRVVGVLTESDFLQRLQAGSFLSLLLRLLDAPERFSHSCHETRVEVVMSEPPVTVPMDADARQIGAAFTRCGGRALPVVDSDGRLCGLLLRKDFVVACPLGAVE